MTSTEQLHIVEALASDYLNVYLVYPAISQIEIVRLNGYITRGLDSDTKQYFSFDDSVRAYVNDRVLAEDIPMMMQVMSLPFLTETMRDRETYDHTYRVNENGRVAYYQMRAKRVVGSDTLILAFRSIDDLVRREQLLEKTLREAKTSGILSQIARRLYSFNLTVDLNTGQHSYIAGTGMPEAQKILSYNFNYQEAFFANAKYVHPLYVDALYDLADIRNLRRHKQQPGFLGSIEYPILFPDREKYEWHEINVFIDADEDGRPIANILARDVTETHERQEKQDRELKAVAQKNKVLSDLTRMLYGFNITLNIETGKYLLIEGTGMNILTKILSQSDEYSIMYERAFQCIAPESRESWAVIASIESLRAHTQNAGLIGSLEYRFLYEGVEQWHETHVFMSVDDHGHHIANILCRDITESHRRMAQRESALRIAASRDQLLSSVTKMLYSFNITVDLKTWRFSLIKGTGASYGVGIIEQNDDYVLSLQRILQILSPEMREIVEDLVGIQALRRIKDKRGYINSITTSCMTPNGLTWQEINLFMGTNDQDEPVAHILGRDITEAHLKNDAMHQLEIANASNEAKTSFLFNMSHDIRTPMNAIMGFTELLERHQKEPIRRAEYIGKIRESSSVLLSIINNVLEMARIEKGTLTLDESPWDSTSFNNTLFTVFEDQMEQKNITFVRSINVIHPRVYCDPIKLREIYINILSNAYKYTNPGGKVTMELLEVPSTRDGYAFYQTTISDTGIGMSADFLPHLFDEFSREHTTTEAKVEGTGLGMHIVKVLLDLMEATIEVKSEVGVGTTFIVTIPHRIANDDEYSVPHMANNVAEITPGSKILLAEDNDLNAEIVIEILSETGVVVERANNGLQCVEMLEAASDKYYDLILMDIQMPIMNGYEATRHIRRMSDANKALIPIIAMTANAFKEDKVEALRAGMNAHLAKPIEYPALLEILSTYIK